MMCWPLSSPLSWPSSAGGKPSMLSVFTICSTNPAIFDSEKKHAARKTARVAVSDCCFKYKN